MTQVKQGATDQTFYFKLVDSAAGTPETGLTITNIDATYIRNRSAAVKNDLTALGAANSAHADNQGIEVDSTNAPGLYRVDFPDAAFASGADKVILSITCSGCDPAMKEIELVANTAEDVYTRIGANGAGLTDLATAANLSTVAGYLDTEIAAILADTNELQTDWADGGRLDLILDARASQSSVDDLPTNAELATALASADDAVLAAIATVDTNVDDLKLGIIFGAAASGTLSTTQATSDLAGYANDQLIGRVIIWLSGDCEGEASDITDYASASGLLTFTALTTAPGDGDLFKIV